VFWGPGFERESAASKEENTEGEGRNKLRPFITGADGNLSGEESIKISSKRHGWKGKKKILRDFKMHTRVVWELQSGGGPRVFQGGVIRAK